MAHMYLLTAAIVIAGWLAMFFSLQRTLKRACAELRLEFQRQINSLSAGTGNLDPAADTQTATAPEVLSPREGQAPGELTPETLATITEAVTALLGRKVRVRSVKILPTPDAIVNPWAQHGRAVVQASRDFSQRSRP
jgi:hypothetical protein